MKCACGCGKVTFIATRTDKRRGHVKGEPMRFVPGHNSLVKPEVAQRALPANEITQEKLLGMRLWGDGVAAAYLDARVRQLEQQSKRSFVETGLILNEMKDRALWEKVNDLDTGETFTSFDHWLANAAPMSRSAGYAAMKALRDITDVPLADLQQMPRCNVMTLQGLSSKVRQNPHVIEAAKTQSEDKFLETLEEKYPEQHIETKRKMELKPTKGARKNIDHAIQAAMALHGLTNREDAMEWICYHYLDAECEVEEYAGLSNRRAYETLQVHARPASVIPRQVEHVEAHPVT